MLAWKGFLIVFYIYSLANQVFSPSPSSVVSLGYLSQIRYLAIRLQMCPKARWRSQLGYPGT